MAQPAPLWLLTALLHSLAVRGVVDLAAWEELDVGLLWLAVTWLLGAVRGGLALACLLAEKEEEEAADQQEQRSQAQSVRIKKQAVRGSTGRLNK